MFFLMNVFSHEFFLMNFFYKCYQLKNRVNFLFLINQDYHDVICLIN